MNIKQVPTFLWRCVVFVSFFVMILGTIFKWEQASFAKLFLLLSLPALCQTFYDNLFNKMGTLLWVCENGTENIALKLLERKNIDVNKVNETNIYGQTPLILSCSNKMERVALKLLERGNVNINHVDVFRLTALDYAIQNNMENVINRINELKNK